MNEMTPASRLLADIESPWNHFARRFIEAPVYRLGAPFPPHPLANFWRLELKQDGLQYVIESDQPVLDTQPVWSKLHSASWVFATLIEYDKTYGWCLCSRAIGAFPGTGNIGKFVKAPDWLDHEEAPLDFAASVRRNLDWFDSLENHPKATYREKGMPAWWWHAAEGGDPVNGDFLPGSFPATGSQGIGALLAAARVWPDRAAHYRGIAGAIGDWLLKNHTPMTGAVPGMPYTAMREGKFEYSVDGSAVNLTRSSIPGSMMLLLHRTTGAPKYLEYAQHIAGVLIRFIREDGSMPYRVNPSTGEEVEPYTCGNQGVGLFLLDLDKVAPDPRWREAAARITRWAIDHPLRDFNWKGCFEDIREHRPFINLTGMDALCAVRLLCRQGELAHARKLFRWVEDQFVNFGDELSLKVPTFYPSVREQWLCDFPMEGHASNYAGTCWEMHRATGDATYRRKGIATLNAIVQSQRADGAYSTWGVDRRTGKRLVGYGGEGSWFNANHAATSGLCRFILNERGENL